MDCAIVENNIIVNVICIPDDARPEDFGGKELPYGKWIGDEYDSSATLEKKLESLEQDGSDSVWDELDKAYQEGYSEGYTEGVNTAYDQ